MSCASPPGRGSEPRRVPRRDYRHPHRQQKDQKDAEDNLKNDKRDEASKKEDDAIAKLTIPTGIPLRYDLDAATLRPLTPGGEYLDPDAAVAAAAAVANQGR